MQSLPTDASQGEKKKFIQMQDRKAIGDYPLLFFLVIDQKQRAINVSRIFCTNTQESSQTESVKDLQEYGTSRIVS